MYVVHFIRYVSTTHFNPCIQLQRNSGATKNINPLQKYHLRWHNNSRFVDGHNAIVIYCKCIQHRIVYSSRWYFFKNEPNLQQCLCNSSNFLLYLNSMRILQSLKFHKLITVPRKIDYSQNDRASKLSYYLWHTRYIIRRLDKSHCGCTNFTDRALR